MASLPKYMKITGTSTENGKFFVHFRIRTWHPAFWAMMWRSCKEYCRKLGVNPYHPVVILRFVRLVINVIVYGRDKS